MDKETLADWIASRQEWFHVFATDSPDGRGWEIVVRIDGTYFYDYDGDQRDALVNYHREHLAGVLDEQGRAWLQRNKDRWGNRSSDSN